MKLSNRWKFSTRQNICVQPRDFLHKKVCIRSYASIRPCSRVTVCYRHQSVTKILTFAPQQRWSLIVHRL